MIGSGIFAGARAVARKELRSGTRGFGVPLLVSSFGALLYLLILGAGGIALSEETTPWKIGATLFLATGTLAGALAGFALPLFASLTLVAEREKRTWDVLRQTPLSPAGIVLGKAAGTIATTLLLLFAALPLLAVSWILGGVAPERFLLAWTHLGLALFLLSTWGINLSADAQTQGRAVGATVASLLALAVLTLPVAFMGLFGDARSLPFFHALYLHPVIAFTRAGVGETSIGGTHLPEWVVADVFLLLLAGHFLASASAKLLRRENDRSPAKRILLAAAFAALFVPGLKHEAVRSGEVFLIPTLVLGALSFYLILLVAPPLDAAETRGRLHLLRPDLDRATSLPLLLAACAGILALASVGEPLLLGRLSLAAGLGGALLVAVGWWSLRVAIEAATGRTGIARAVWAALLLFMMVSSAVPGLPHSYDKYLDPDPSLSSEILSAVNPVHVPLTVLRAERDYRIRREHRAWRELTWDERRGLLGIQLRAAAGACAVLLLPSAALWILATRRERKRAA